MTGVIVRSSSAKKPLQRNSWVRVKKNDDYKDDSAGSSPSATAATPSSA